MFFVTVIQQYVVWHYGQALVLYVRVYRNLNWFVAEFFSLRELTRSLFAPYRRITETPSRRFDLGEWVSAKIINLVSRLLGAIIRLFIITTGIIALCLLAVSSVTGYVAWLLAPLLTYTAIIGGGYLLIISLL
jgi:hypothetical protein